MNDITRQKIKKIAKNLTETLKKPKNVIKIWIGLVIVIVILGNLTRCPSGGKQQKPSPSPSTAFEEVPVQIEELLISPSPYGSGDSSSGSPISTVIPTIKEGGFDAKELQEIKQDGYLSYYYRRKYSGEEVKTVWKAVHSLLPDYTQDEKLLATRSILAYHWVVYRTTMLHNMTDNVKITRKYKSIIEKFAHLHQIPSEIPLSVIAWENSGGEGKTSWAECVGVGQLSMGAVETSHGFYAGYVPNIKQINNIYNVINKKFPSAHLTLMCHSRGWEVEFFDIAKKHQALAKAKNVKDERLIPECNIEDAVIYLKLLYNNYDNRMDLAISAYHNGGVNNNDIIGDYLKRVSGGSYSPQSTQKQIIEGIQKYNLKYIHLWKDTRSRDMLNGLRTVFGDITDYDNDYYALGDESDIYVWKVIASYGALNADEKTLQGLTQKYRGVWDYAETRGIRMYDSYDKIRNSIKSGWLVKIPQDLIQDNGISALKDGSSDYYKNRAMYNYYTSPEIIGFLVELTKEYRIRTKNPQAKIPVKELLNSRLLESDDISKIPQIKYPYLQGIALDIDLANAENQDVLYRILKELFLHDHIFFINSRDTGENRVTLNPRYGKYYYSKYQQYKKEKGNERL